MSKFRIFLIIFFLSCFLFDCLSIDNRIYYDKKEKFSIKIPDSWKIKKKNINKSKVIHIFNPNDTTYIAILVDNSKSKDTLYEYYKQSKSKMENMFKNNYFSLNILNESENKLNNIDYKKILFEVSNIDKENKKNIIYTIKIEKTFYMITFSTKKELFDNYQSIFDDVFQSFNIK